MMLDKLILPHIVDTGRVLFLGCGDGRLAFQLAQQYPQLELTLTDWSLVALDATRKLFASNGLAHVLLMPTPPAADPGGDFDMLFIDLPQSRALARRWLCEAWQRLREGGWLYLSGPNELGIKSVIDDMRLLFGAVQVLGYGKHGRAARSQKAASAAHTLPAWTQQPGIAPGSWHELTFTLDGKTHSLRSLPGVFSYERLDAATALLLDHLPIAAEMRVLDAGCGYGILGIAAALRGAAHVDMLDINMLAVAAARENIGRVQLPNGVTIAALACDGLGCVADRRYDLIVSNPPFHEGKQIDYRAVTMFVEQGRSLLLPGGRLLMVANVFLRYERELARLFRSVTVLAENRSFRVIEGWV